MPQPVVPQPAVPQPAVPQPVTPPVPEPGTRAPRFPAATILGYPRIGPRRELKRAMEARCPEFFEPGFTLR